MLTRTSLPKIQDNFLMSYETKKKSKKKSDKDGDVELQESLLSEADENDESESGEEDARTDFIS